LVHHSAGCDSSHRQRSHALFLAWSPCFEEELGTRGGPPPFIGVTPSKGGTKVTFAVEMAFDLVSGRSAEWQRLSVANHE
jgi:hypothetical protein